MEEPVNKFDFREPTNEENEDHTTPKHNFNETFDHPMFKERSSEGGVRLKGEPRARCMHDHQLTVSSHPDDWLDAMLPTYKYLHKKTTTPPYIYMHMVQRESKIDADGHCCEVSYIHRVHSPNFLSVLVSIIL